LGFGANPRQIRQFFSQQRATLYTSLESLTITIIYSGGYRRRFGVHTMQNLNLYQLSAKYIEALDFLTDPEMDLPIEAINDTLEGLSGGLEEKAVNVAKFLRNLEATAEAIKEAEADMAKRRRAFESRVKWLKSYLKDSMENTGITKIECPFFKLSIQKNPVSVEVFDENLIPEQFKEVVTTWKIDKNAIKEALKNGETVAGAMLLNGTRLAIK
jgi:hypothetical protein